LNTRRWTLGAPNKITAAATGARFADGDFDGDGDVDYLDYRVMKAHMGEQFVLPLAGLGGLATLPPGGPGAGLLGGESSAQLLSGDWFGSPSAPEPGTLALLAAGLVAVLRRRRGGR
jgi:hypothetical protein